MGVLAGHSDMIIRRKGPLHPAHLDRLIHEFWLHTKRGHRSIYLGGMGGDDQHFV